MKTVKELIDKIEKITGLKVKINEKYSSNRSINVEIVTPNDFSIGEIWLLNHANADNNEPPDWNLEWNCTELYLKIKKFWND